MGGIPSLMFPNFVYFSPDTMVAGRFGPKPFRTLGRFGPESFRPGRFGLGRFGPILELGRFGQIGGSFRPIFFSAQGEGFLISV